MACSSFAYFRIIVRVWEGGADGEILHCEVFSPRIMCERVEKKKPTKFQLKLEPKRGQIRTDDDVISEELNESFWEIFDEDVKFDSEDPDEIRYFEMTGGYWSHVTYDSWTGEYDVDNDVTDFVKAEVTEESVRERRFLEDLDPESGAPDVDTEREVEGQTRLY